MTSFCFKFLFFFYGFQDSHCLPFLDKAPCPFAIFAPARTTATRACSWRIRCDFSFPGANITAARTFTAPARLIRALRRARRSAVAWRVGWRISWSVGRRVGWNVHSDTFSILLHKLVIRRTISGKSIGLFAKIHNQFFRNRSAYDTSAVLAINGQEKGVIMQLISSFDKRLLKCFQTDCRTTESAIIIEPPDYRI